MDRFALAELREWKTRRSRKPLVMRGARQVGKTWLVRKLAATEFESLLEVNFEQTPGAGALFASNDPAKILPLLAAQFGQRVEPGRTLLFLDEVQAAPQVLLSLRYFFEKMPDLHVIAAGSLLEFALAEHSFSMPVGRIEYFFLDPMTFGEFLCASGRGSLLDFLRSWRGPDAFPAPIHAECMELLRRYLTVGGMPESVAAFLDGGADFEASERARQGILSTFADDFAKYSRRVPVENVRKVFESVPRQLGEKFTWAKVQGPRRVQGPADVRFGTSVRGGRGRKELQGALPRRRPRLSRLQPAEPRPRGRGGSAARQSGRGVGAVRRAGAGGGASAVGAARPLLLGARMPVVQRGGGLPRRVGRANLSGRGQVRRDGPAPVDAPVPRREGHGLRTPFQRRRPFVRQDGLPRQRRRAPSVPAPFAAALPCLRSEAARCPFRLLRRPCALVGGVALRSCRVDLRFVGEDALRRNLRSQERHRQWFDPDHRRQQVQRRHRRRCRSFVRHCRRRQT